MRCLAGLLLLATITHAQTAGAVLGAAEIEQLEATVAANPADRTAQTLLGRNYAFGILGITALGQYDSVTAMDSAKAAGPFAQHARDVMRQSTIAGLIAESARALWSFSSQAASFAFLHGNASANYDQEKAFAVEVLDRSIAIDPNTQDWRAYRVPITVFRTNFSGVLPLKPLDGFAIVKDDVAQLTGLLRSYALADAAKLAVRAAALDDAAAYARELLSATSRDWNYGNAVYFGNMVMGQIALRRGDAQSAAARLLDAARTPGSPQLNSFGPNMTLARELLTGDTSFPQNRRFQHAPRRVAVLPERCDVVLQFFDLCRNFWSLGAQRLNQWSDQVRSGIVPDFSGNLYY